MNPISKEATISINTQIVSVIDKHIQQQAVIIGGESLSPDEIKARLNRETEALQQLAVARANLQKQQAITDAAKEVGAATRKGLRGYLALTLPNGQRSVLAEFGFKPARGMTPMSPEAKVVAKAKAKATRLARHTMGKRQRLAIKGALAPATRADVVPAGHDAE